MLRWLFAFNFDKGEVREYKRDTGWKVKFVRDCHK